MRFLQPLFPDVSIEPPVYSDGVLQENHPPPLQSKAYQFSELLSESQADLYRDYVNKPDIKTLSNQQLQECVAIIASGMAAYQGLYHVAFRNTQNGCEPFMLSVPLFDHSTPQRLKTLMEAAVASAQMGLMLEFYEDIAQRHPELRPIYEKCKEIGDVVAAPYYEYSKERNQRELHGVFVWMRMDDVPFTDHAWSRLSSYLIVGMKPFLAARDLGKVPPYDPQQLVPRNDDRKWDDGVRIFRRDHVPEMVQKTEKADDWNSILSWAIYYLGFGDPHSLHPKRLYKKLQSTHDAAAMAMTSATQKISAALSTSVISQTWLDTLHHVFGGVTSVIPDTEKVFFVNLFEGFIFRIVHDSPEPLSDEENLAIGNVAQWAALFGEAVFDTAADNRKVFNHLRAVAKCDVPIVAIPVYSWEVGLKGTPSLHGVFVALRHPNAPAPVYSTQLAWALATQYLLSPLAVAAEEKRSLYSPVSIEDNMCWVYERPAFPFKPQPEPHFHDFVVPYRGANLRK